MICGHQIIYNNIKYNFKLTYGPDASSVLFPFVRELYIDVFDTMDTLRTGHLSVDAETNLVLIGTPSDEYFPIDIHPTNRTLANPPTKAPYTRKQT